MNLEIANRLLALRREHGYSQEELAYKLGVSRQAVSKWERAESSPDTDNLLALARLYGVSLDALLLHTPAGEAAQAAPEPEEAPADEDAEIFAAARAWDAAEEAEQKARKRARAKWKEGLLWLLTLALTGGDPNHFTEMLALNIYQTFYARAGAQWKGLGQAKAVLFCVLVIAISMIQLKATRSREVQQ